MWDFRRIFHGNSMEVPQKHRGAPKGSPSWDYSIPLGSLAVLLWDFHGTPMAGEGGLTGSYSPPETSMGPFWDCSFFPLDSHGAAMGLLSSFHGSHTAPLWRLHCCRMGLPHGTSMGHPWCFHGASMGLPWRLWCVHGVPMGLPLGFHGIFRGTSVRLS